MGGLGVLRTCSYDSFGSMLTETDPRGVVMKYEYDGAGNRTKLIRDFGGPLERETS